MRASESRRARWPGLLVIPWVIGCTPAPTAGGGAPIYSPQYEAAAVPPPAGDPAEAGQLVDKMTDFAFVGGQIEFDMRKDGTRVIEVARNRYAVPIVMQWQFANLQNLEPLAPTAGVTVLPAAKSPSSDGPPVILTQYEIADRHQAYHREVSFHPRFGDPSARPTRYAYRLPYKAGKTFSVLQGWHGAFSHRGSNEYAIDFDCPIATRVLAARPGVVVAANASAQGAGTTQDYLDYRKTNFVLVMHDDGTLGEYMHLAPSGVEVQAGQRVERGDELALSGNTGFSSTPHLHFQVMTAADDGIAALSFPFQFAVAPNRAEDPVEGRAYPGWE